MRREDRWQNEISSPSRNIYCTNARGHSGICSVPSTGFQDCRLIIQFCKHRRKQGSENDFPLEAQTWVQILNLWWNGKNKMNSQITQSPSVHTPVCKNQVSKEISELRKITLKVATSKATLDQGQLCPRWSPGMSSCVCAQSFSHVPLFVAPWIVAS